MPVDKEFLTALKEKSNIVDVVRSYVQLEKKGINYWGCCPFHREKTPSFSVNEREGFYHCFGCEESGDVIKFVSEIEDVGFMDSVKILADRAGIPMPQDDYSPDRAVEQKRKRESLLRILNDTAHFYLDNLSSGRAEEHVAYILKRKIPSNIVRTFGLGASLNFYDLPKYLASKGYSRQDILDSGTVSETEEGELIDAEGGRLIFPIIGAMGDVLGFGGRTLKNSTDRAKYKNTRETQVFSKGKMLYNVNLLKKLKKEQGIPYVIIVEGYMDVLTLYAAGFRNVAAGMGTSLTADQARLLRRYTQSVVFCCDGDEAGQKANLRGLDVFAEEGISVMVAPLPNGTDPDDYIKTYGADAFAKLLDAAVPLIDYKIAALGSDYDLSKTDDKRKYVSEALKIVRTAPTAAVQEDLLKQIRDRTGFTYESLSRDLGREPKNAHAETKPAKRKESVSAAWKASRFVAAAYLFKVKYADGDPRRHRYVCEAHSMIASFVYACSVMGDDFSVSEVFDLFEENTPEYDEFVRVLDFGDGSALDGDVAEKYFTDCVNRLEINALDAEIDALSERVKTCRDSSEVSDLSKKLQEALKKKNRLMKAGN